MPRVRVGERFGTHVYSGVRVIVDGRGEGVKVEKTGVFTREELSGFIKEFIVETWVIVIRKSSKWWQGGWGVRGKFERERKRSVDVIAGCIFPGEQVEKELVM